MELKSHLSLLLQGNDKLLLDRNEGATMRLYWIVILNIVPVYSSARNWTPIELPLNSHWNPVSLLLQGNRKSLLDRNDIGATMRHYWIVILNIVLSILLQGIELQLNSHWNPRVPASARDWTPIELLLTSYWNPRVSASERNCPPIKKWNLSNL